LVQRGLTHEQIMSCCCHHQLQLRQAHALVFLCLQLSCLMLLDCIEPSQLLAGHRCKGRRRCLSRLCRFEYCVLLAAIGDSCLRIAALCCTHQVHVGSGCMHRYAQGRQPTSVSCRFMRQLCNCRNSHNSQPNSPPLSSPPPPLPPLPNPPLLPQFCVHRICSGGRLTPRDLNVPDDMLHEANAANVARPAAAGMSMAAAAAAAGGPLQVQEDCSISGVGGGGRARAWGVGRGL
jgi:hypothetical protein